MAFMNMTSPQRISFSVKTNIFVDEQSVPFWSCLFIRETTRVLLNGQGKAAQF